MCVNRLLLAAALVTLLAGCQYLPAGKAGPTSTMQVRCVMSTADQSILVVWRVPPSPTEQAAVSDACVPNQKSGLAPVILSTSTDNYKLVCEGGISPIVQTTGTIWAKSDDPRAYGTAYDMCRMFYNPVYQPQ